ncbi:NAD(P)/FAD-dependent oxidoreductase [Aliifodinibius sp. S!AR15-10]|uniref:NAD(P)-binding domain-containing protein n=1 Tax=Aliifodinibius sp. S!AR15-10 TaxID=2950437 RepID=UPI002856A133|nr:NAD(P)-binding domain-containing protein [Aliifodinibius sp. S!AR15-10]MDR8390029.1 NAD(P)/FAD-dependent oxidoreductase [Aliifodinibius sp. S!AR15-10]
MADARTHTNDATDSKPASRVLYKTDIVVIGAGQAGLSSAYHLRREGMEPGRGFVVLDQSEDPGGAWQHRWPSLTLSTVNGIHDLPGLSFDEAVNTDEEDIQANIAVPKYFRRYEQEFNLPVYRPVKVMAVCDRGNRLKVETDGPHFSTSGIMNATGTWESPHLPEYPGNDRFKGRQLHTKDYKTADEFKEQHVVIVGGGISAIELLDEISQVTTTTWVTRRPPDFREGPFTKEDGRAAVAIVEERVRNGQPPGSIVSLTGLPVTDHIKSMKKHGVLKRRAMFSEITETGVRWSDGTTLRADVILWCTGFHSSLDHLAPLMLRNDDGGITMTGRLATKVEKDPRIHLVGYGPSASTIGANRAGGAAARELMKYLGLR